MKLRKMLTALLAGTMLTNAVIVGAVPASKEQSMPFTDVESSKWYYDNIKFVYENEYMIGTGKTAFSPNTELSRAMFVTALGRMAGVSDGQPDTFPDTKKDSWYSSYVGWAVEQGIIEGFPNGTFCPDDPMTREQMAAAICRYIESQNINMPRDNTAPGVFADSDDIGEWAEEYVETLRCAGIVIGDQNENYNPESNITRAEAAAVLKNITDAEEKAWQGYIPNPEKDGFAVYGANYLYWGGTAVSGGLATELDETTEPYPVLQAFYNEQTAEGNTNKSAVSTGVCTTELKVDITKTPVMKICYSYEGYNEPETLTGAYAVNPLLPGRDWIGEHYITSFSEPLTFIKGTADEGFSTATVDLTDITKAHPELKDDPEVLQNTTFTPKIYSPGVNSNIDISHILINAFEEGYEGDAKFNIRYIAFFEDQESADAFESSSRDEYLKDYFRYSNTFYEELTDSVEENYNKLLHERIDEIMNADNVVNPEDILASGHKCYYVSSENGDDSNEGTSPDKPWKSLSALFYKKFGEKVSIPKRGDAVFFERGSEFYAEQYNNYGVTCLEVQDGVSYSSYGDTSKPKPLFTCAIDFRDRDNTGIWLETDYDNIWVLDEIDPDPAFCGGNKCDIGCIVFDNGEAIGVRVVPQLADDDMDNPFGEGITTRDYGILSGDGIEYFHTGGTSCENVGQALNHNYEYLHDKYNGKLYLYFDKGNPGEYFDDIKVSRSGYCLAGGGEDLVLDNLSIMYSSCWGAAVGGKNLLATNCEFGYVAGSLASIESGIEIFGASDGTRLINNYCHDIGDGPLSLQSTDEWNDTPILIQNVELSGNVVVACGNGFEIWNHSGAIDGYGVGLNKLININIHDNIMAYTGYGICQRQEEHKLGDVFCTYGEMENCVIEGNTIMYAAGSLFGPHFSTDVQKRGWQIRDNTYILNPEFILTSETSDAFDARNSHSYAFKGTHTSIPYDYRYLSYMGSIGIETTGKYYYYTGSTEAEKNDAFFMTGTLAYNKYKE